MLKPDAAMQSHNEPVCFLRGVLPTKLIKEELGAIRGGKRWYGSMTEVLNVMAVEARRIGADAVIGLDARRDANAVAWARPVADGTAVRLNDPTQFNCAEFSGTLY